MKKYLINGAMALIVGGFIVSCSHDDISQPATVDQMTKSFDEMFTELYGPIAENHTWGFNSVEVPADAIAAAEAEAAATRAATRAGERISTRIPNDFGWEVTSDYVKEFDQSFFTAVQTYLPEGQNAGSQINNFEFASQGPFEFCIIYSQTSGTDKVGYYYYNPATQTINDKTEIVFVDNIQNFSNYVQFYKNNDWTNPGAQESEGTWKYKSATKARAKKFTVNIPAGYRVGFFLQQGDFKAYSNSALNNYNENTKENNYYSAIVNRTGVPYLLGLEDWNNQWYNSDMDCNDVIMAINRETDTPPTVVDYTGPSNPDAYKESKTKQTYTHKQIVDQGRVFCEDIATAYRNVTEDIDYNDIVFDARVWQIYDQDATTVNNITTYSSAYNYRWQYDISLLATGGTIEEKINGVDVHNKFGVGQAFMVNTWTPNCSQSLSGQWNTPTNLMQPKDFSYTLKYDELPNAPKVGISTIPIEVKYDGTHSIKALDNRVETEVTDSEGKTRTASMAPYKLCLPIGKPWPIERVNIKDAYKSFSVYVENPDYEFYNSDTEDTNLYTQAPESSIQKDGKTTESPEEVTQSGDAENSNVWVVWKGDVSTDGSAITLYNFTFQSGQTLRFFGSGTITVVCGEGSSKKVITDGSMSAGYVDVPIDDAEEAAMLSQGIFVTGSFTLTKIVVL